MRSLGLHKHFNNAGSGASPLIVSGCVLWLRADLGITLSGSAVTQWSDQSGSGNHVTPIGTGPTFSTSGGRNGGKSIVYTGAVRPLRNTMTLAQPCTLITLASDTDTAHQHFLLDGNTGLTRTHYISGGTARMAGPSVVTGASVSDGVWYRQASVFNGANSKIRVDDTTSGNLNAGAGAASGMTIGTFGDGSSNPWNGALEEVIAYNKALTSAELDALFEYLASRGI